MNIFGKIKHTINRQRLAWLCMLVGLLGIGISIVFYVERAEPPTNRSSPNAVSIAGAPSSKKLSQSSIDSYQVPAADPKFIAIPAIKVSKTPIIKLGLLKSGAIATPDNIYETGWFDGSVLPGQSGAMFIYGHVSSWTADGIFYNLKKLRVGNLVTITRGDNKTYTYQVVSTKIYPYNKVDMHAVLSPIVASKPGLNLMTCTGQVMKGTSEFNERLVVFTKLVS